MYLKKDELIIRNAEKDDAATLCSWWNDGRVMEHAGFPYGLGISEAELIESLSKDDDSHRRRLIIEYQNIKIGEMNFNIVNDDIAKIGIKICEEDYQNKGLGRRCLSMLIKELFSMGYKKIILDTSPNNLRARHVYETLGFKYIGIRKDCFKNQLGELCSAVDYELLLDDFNDFS